MKLTITKEVPLSQVFGHALAAWDWTVYEWYRGVRYTVQGDALAFSPMESASSVERPALVRGPMQSTRSQEPHR